jgi:hypothetical protein
LQRAPEKCVATSSGVRCGNRCASVLFQQGAASAAKLLDAYGAPRRHRHRRLHHRKRRYDALPLSGNLPISTIGVLKVAGVAVGWELASCRGETVEPIKSSLPAVNRLERVEHLLTWKSSVSTSRSRFSPNALSSYFFNENIC